MKVCVVNQVSLFTSLHSQGIVDSCVKTELTSIIVLSYFKHSDKTKQKETRAKVYKKHIKQSLKHAVLYQFTLLEPRSLF